MPSFPKVHEKLKTNRRERDAKAAIVGELEKTETRLVLELKHMINVADEEKENLNAVHDKLDRQRQVDLKNEVRACGHLRAFFTWLIGVLEADQIKSKEFV